MKEEPLLLLESSKYVQQLNFEFRAMCCCDAFVAAKRAGGAARQKFCILRFESRTARKPTLRTVLCTSHSCLGDPMKDTPRVRVISRMSDRSPDPGFASQPKHVCRLLDYAGRLARPKACRLENRC